MQAEGAADELLHAVIAGLCGGTAYLSGRERPREGRKVAGSADGAEAAGLAVDQMERGGEHQERDHHAPQTGEEQRPAT